LKQKKRFVLDINGFCFCMSTQVKAEVRSNNAFTWVRKRKRNPLYLNTYNIVLCLWTSLPDVPITTLVKLFSSFIKRTAKTSTCNIGLYQRPVTDIRDRIYKIISGGIIHRLIHGPRDDISRGLMTRAIWKRPCINLFITYFARADNMLLPFTRRQITCYCPSQEGR
jgi:hypothetical protein